MPYDLFVNKQLQWKLSGNHQTLTCCICSGLSWEKKSDLCSNFLIFILYIMNTQINKKNQQENWQRSLWWGPERCADKHGWELGLDKRMSLGDVPSTITTLDGRLPRGKVDGNRMSHSHWIFISFITLPTLLSSVLSPWLRPHSSHMSCYVPMDRVPLRSMAPWPNSSLQHEKEREWWCLILSEMDWWMWSCEQAVRAAREISCYPV